MTGTGDALLRHDGAIAWNVLRSTFASWSDRLIAALGIGIAMIALQQALSAQGSVHAAAVMAGVAALVGLGAGRAVQRRLVFHGTDGVLAARALERASRRRYRIVLHAAAGAMIALIGLLARSDVGGVAPAGYLIGAACGDIVARRGGSWMRRRHVRAVRVRLHRPLTGAALAVPVGLAALLFRSDDPVAPVALVAVLASGAMFALTALDAASIRFMTLAGISATRIVARHARPASAFLALAVPACLLRSGTMAGVVAAVAAVVMMLMVARILAYRIHAKRAADTLVSIAVGLVALAAVAAPALALFVLVIVMIHLARRSARQTWLLA